MVLLRTSTTIGRYRHFLAVIASPTVLWRPLNSAEVRCHIGMLRCVARNARCDTTPHLTADAVLFFPHMYRAKHLM